MPVRLPFISSDYVVMYVTAHPVNWYGREEGLNRLGGMGDQAGLPPVPLMEVFFGFLKQRNGQLFDQQEYESEVWARVTAWAMTLSREQMNGFKSKLYCNFYVSAVDSLHVWALLSEAGWFDRCVLSTEDDVLSKTDLTLYRDGKICRVGLRIGTQASMDARRYKSEHRDPNSAPGIWECILPINRDRAPGNKRWYCLEDFAELRPEAQASRPMQAVAQ